MDQQKSTKYQTRTTRLTRRKSQLYITGYIRNLSVFLGSVSSIKKCVVQNMDVARSPGDLR